MTDLPAPGASRSPAAPRRPAATVLLLRQAEGQGEDGIEVLMLRRHQRSGFAGGAWVFPGGVVDEDDRTLPPNRYSGIDPAASAARFSLDPADTLGMYAAAVRETFEEAGVLLAHHSDGRPVEIEVERLVRLRADLNDREVDADWSGFLEETDLVLDLAAMTYWLRWVTPVQEPRRYDTCFFLARIPPGQRPVHDAIETTETRWVDPVAALAAGEDLPVIFPTRRTLEWMAPFRRVADLIDHAAAQPMIGPLQPHIVLGDDGSYVDILMPGDHGYPPGVLG